MKILLLFLSGCILCLVVYSQDNIPIDNSLESTNSTKIDKIFPAILVYNIPTTTVLRRGEMKLYLAHRMGTLGTGIEGSFGLYQANSRIGADLGIINNISIGVGSTSQQKLYDGYIKYQLTKQSDIFPFESAIYSSIIFSNMKLNVPKEQQFLWQQINYYNQIMISRLIINKIALQLMFGYIHKNIVMKKADKNDMFSGGMTLSIKLNRMFYFATEYIFIPKNSVISNSIQSHIISTGIQIHTGPRHVFQIFLSNSVGILPHTVISETTSSFIPKNIRISFNIPTTFNLF